MDRTSYLFCVLVIALSVYVNFSEGHSYLTRPQPRVFRSTWGCRLGGPAGFIQNCPGPCAAPYSPSQPRARSSRGAPLGVEWPRNNHPGGFIRLAWLPSDQTDRADAHALFDGNVQQYSCHEVHCQADAGPGSNGGDTLGENGENPCYLNTTVPTHLTDGMWTLQWAWYGGGPNGYLGDYYSCANFEITGGQPVGPQAAPVFRGGDVSNPSSNVCKYWNTDRLHYCVSEPCISICNPSTSPVNRCGDPSLAGAPYIEPLINPTVPTTSTPTTSEETTSTKTQGPTSTGADVEVNVIVTVRIQMSPDIFDPTVFVYDITDLLQLPVAAVKRVDVNLDEGSDTETVVIFTLTNALDSNGTPINPVAAARELKAIAESGDPRLSSQYNLAGLEVLDTDVSSAQAVTVTLTLILFASAALFA